MIYSLCIILYYLLYFTILCIGYMFYTSKRTNEESSAGLDEYAVVCIKCLEYLLLTSYIHSCLLEALRNIHGSTIVV